MAPSHAATGNNIEQTPSRAAGSTADQADGPPWTVLANCMLGGLLLILALGLAADFRTALDQASIALASLAAGTMVGFLFGLPRSATAEMSTHGPSAIGGTGTSSTPQFRPNTNLEQVSDWLTKILIGVGLVQLNSLRELLASTGAYVVLNSAPAVQGIGIITQSNIVIFAILGFLSGYMWTRVHFGGIQLRADSIAWQLLQDMNKKVDAQGVLISQQAAETAETKAVTTLFATGELAAPAKRRMEKLAAQDVSEEAPSGQAMAGWPLEIAQKVDEFRGMEADWDADPVAELFPNVPSEANGRRLTIDVVATADDVLTLSARVVRTGGAPLIGSVTFLLHPTFPESVITKRTRNNTARASFWAQEWFTLAAIADHGETILTYDLRRLPGAPRWFIASGGAA